MISSRQIALHFDIVRVPITQLDRDRYVGGRGQRARLISGLLASFVCSLRSGNDFRCCYLFCWDQWGPYMSMSQIKSAEIRCSDLQSLTLTNADRYKAGSLRPFSFCVLLLASRSKEGVLLFMRPFIWKSFVSDLWRVSTIAASGLIKWFV